jgi:acetolactate synthase regulatory subunit
MATIKLYFDEDVTDALTRVLRARGFDALSVYAASLKGKTDLEQLEFAVSQHRAIFTFNVKHFAELAKQYSAEGKSHYGIIVSNQLPFSELLHRVLNLLRLRTAEEMVDRLDWLQNYK